MKVSALALKVGSALATLATCALSGVVVALDLKPAGAPLHPPVVGANPVPSLSIPVTPLCQTPVPVRGKKGGAKSAHCSAGSGGVQATEQPIAPSVVDLPASSGAPITSTYAS